MLATGKYYDLALITTDLTTPVEQIISRYAARWTIEVVFAQMRQNLGVGQARNRTARAVERTVPFGLTTYTHEPRQQDHATGESRASEISRRNKTPMNTYSLPYGNIGIVARFRSGCQLSD